MLLYQCILQVNHAKSKHHNYNSNATKIFTRSVFAPHHISISRYENKLGPDFLSCKNVYICQHGSESNNRVIRFILIYVLATIINTGFYNNMYKI